MRVFLPLWLPLSAVLVGLLTFADLAKAQFIVEPDSFPAGTNISGSFPGVTLREADSGGNALGDVSSFSDPTRASTGTRVFGSVSQGNPFWFFSTSPSSGRVLRADFAAPANFVQLDFINNDGATGGANPDVGILRAFDASGTSLAAVTTAVLLNNGDFQSLSSTRPTADIADILAGGSEATGDDINLDNLRFNAFTVIPEPSTLALLAVGTRGVLGYGWRQRQRAWRSPRVAA